MISASSIKDAFPEVSPGVRPLGQRVLVQLRTVRSKSEAGLIIVDETRQFNKAVTQLGKVVALGPIAYKNRDTALDWPEGAWVSVGDYVRVPRYGGDRFERKIPGTDETAIFCVFQDHEIMSAVELEAFDDLNELL